MKLYTQMNTLDADCLMEMANYYQRDVDEVSQAILEVRITSLFIVDT